MACASPDRAAGPCKACRGRPEAEGAPVCELRGGVGWQRANPSVAAADWGCSVWRATERVRRRCWKPDERKRQHSGATAVPTDQRRLSATPRPRALTSCGRSTPVHSPRHANQVCWRCQTLAALMRTVGGSLLLTVCRRAEGLTTGPAFAEEWQAGRPGKQIRRMRGRRRGCTAEYGQNVQRAGEEQSGSGGELCSRCSLSLSARPPPPPPAARSA